MGGEVWEEAHLAMVADHLGGSAEGASSSPRAQAVEVAEESPAIAEALRARAVVVKVVSGEGG